MVKDRQTQMRDYYDQSDYFERFADHYGAKDSAFNQYARKYIFSIYTPAEDERILDVGCGWGNISLALLRQGRNLVGLDYSVKSAQICRQGSQELGLSDSRFVCADAGNMSFGSGSFDVIYAAGVIEHMYPENYARFINEARRVLSDRGRLVLGTPNPHHVFELLKRNNILMKEDASHVDYKTLPRITKTLEQNGFEIERAYYYHSHVKGFAALEKLTSGFIPIMRRRICVLARKTG